MNLNSPVNNTLTLIDDNPAQDDRFGAHARISQAIAKLVSSNSGGKTIALIGEWGSGKSTTILQLRKNLNDDYKIFTYDAWVHSGDHLRKAFLNELIDSLIDSEWIIDEENNKKYWLDLKETLAGRLKVKVESSEPEFTPQGKVLVPFLLGLPISSILFNNLIQGYIKDQYFFTPYHSVILVVTILAFLSMLFPFAYLMWHIWTGNKNSSKILSIFLNKSISKETTTSLEEAEATTIEFQDIFKKIISKALSNKHVQNKRKLIIVIDNLDRLDKDEAKYVWSLLKGFIDNPTYKKNKAEDWLDSLWVIVPLAKSKPLNTNDGNNQSGTDELFLEKIFQVRFNLPPPVQADWRKYLNDLLIRTFPQSFSSHFAIIVRLYENHVFETNKNRSLPTPRELILFVNDLIVTVLQWKETFDLSSCAAYVLTYKREPEILKRMRSGQIPTDAVKRILNNDPIKTFSALYFNIDDVDKAHSILLEPVIESALRNNDSKTLIKVIKDFPSVHDVIETLIDHNLPNWVDDNPESFFNGVICILDVCSSPLANGENAAPMSLSITVVQRTEYALERSFNAFPLLIRNAFDAIEKISQLNIENNIANSLISSLNRLNKLPKNYNESIYPTESDNSSKIWIPSLIRLYENKLFKQHFDSLKHNPIILPLSIESWNELCYEHRNNYSFLETIYLNKKTDEINNYFSDNIQNSTYEYNHHFLLKRELLNKKNTTIYNVLVSATKEILSQGITGEATKNLIEDLLIFRSKSKVISDYLKEETTVGQVAHIYYQSYKSGFTEHLPIYLQLLLLTNPSLVKYSALANSANGIDLINRVISDPISNDQLIKDLASSVKTTGEFQVVKKVLESNPNSIEFLKKLVSNFEQKRLIFDTFDINKITEETNNYLKLGGDETQKICREVIEYFINKEDFIKFLIENKPTQENEMFYSLVLENSKCTDKKILKNFEDYLKSISKDIWVKNLKSYTWLVKTAIDLTTKRPKFKLNSTVKEALNDLLRDSISNEKDITIGTKEFHKILNSLSDQQYDSFLEDIYEFSAQADVHLSNTYWKLFGDILKNSVLKLRSNAKPIRRLFKPIVKANDEIGIRWIINLLNNYNLSTIDIDANSKKDLKVIIKDQLNIIEETNPLFTTMNELLRILNKRK